MTDDTNTRVTNAVLGVKIEHLSGKVDKAVDRMDKQTERSAEVEKCIAVLKRDVTDLDERVNRWSIANSAGVLVAAILAYFGIRN